MSIRSTPERWGAITRFLHWGMSIALAGMVAFGVYMTDLPPSVRKIRYYAMHKSVGIVLLGLVVVRLVWRLVDGRPRAVPMSRWQARAGFAMALVLYALLAAIPLSGWWYNSLAGFPLRWFDVVNLPALAAADPVWKPIVRTAHHWLAWLLVGCVAVHAAAALKHHLIDRDSTLRAMLPMRRRRVD